MSRDSVNQAIGTFATEFGMTRDVLRRILSEARVRPVDKRAGHPVYRLRDVYNAIAREQDPEALSPHARLARARAIETEDRIRAKRQELVEASDVERQFAVVFQSVNRAFDNAIDGLERDLELAPEAVEFLEKHFDRVREQLAQELKNGD